MSRPPKVPALPDVIPPKEKRPRGRPPKDHSKADKLEEKAYSHIMELFADYEKVKNGQTLEAMMKKDPYLASTIVKDLNQMTKQILNITIAKLRIEELRSQRNEGNGNNGSQVVFILQGRDLPITDQKVIEVGSDNGVANFKATGRD